MTKTNSRTSKKVISGVTVEQAQGASLELASPRFIGGLTGLDEPFKCSHPVETKRLTIVPIKTYAATSSVFTFT